MKNKDPEFSKITNDKILFHDIKNFVHGLSFFIGSKVSSNEGLTISEAVDLEKELSSLQHLIEGALDQKQLKNKSKDLGILFKKLKNDINTLVKARYCNNIEFQIEPEVKVMDNQAISYNVFLRIFQNLIFNLAENSTNKGGLIRVSYENGLLRVFTRNEISRIKNSNKKGFGLGLSSIKLLVDELGGDFTFRKSNNFWENICIMPL